ncbi:hypothetical protein ACMAUO_09280 [Gluconacetobacter sp. Hr-1-5]|uniref:hypothetical protein n=1 Tax=Gluconacetobacter sp. Hr-1-5 TaxID=3395370 RepID=UPI003B519FFB
MDDEPAAKRGRGHCAAHPTDVGKSRSQLNDPHITKIHLSIPASTGALTLGPLTQAGPSDRRIRQNRPLLSKTIERARFPAANGEKSSGEGRYVRFTPRFESHNRATFGKKPASDRISLEKSSTPS